MPSVLASGTSVLVFENYMNMKVNALQQVQVTVDPFLVIVELEKEWMGSLGYDLDSYIKEGHWYTEDRYGPDQQRKATEEEMELYEAFALVREHAVERNKKVKGDG